MLSVGEILKREREKKGISLNQIEKEIKTRAKFLEAIENNNWDYFTSKIYIEGVIKNYSKFLGLDWEKCLAFFRREYAKKEEILFKEKISSKYLTPETKKITFFTLLVVFLAFFGYFGYQLKLYLSPPKVIIVSPKQDIFKREQKIKIIGKTEKEAIINIFGDRIYQDKEGIFEYEFPLKIGKNTLLIEVTGANGKKTVIEKDFFKQP